MIFCRLCDIIIFNVIIMEVSFLADSNITKRAFASALKELMESQPFSKVSVGSICDKCDMNRKSFYYHFKDKYDLVNWIFDTGFIAAASRKNYENRWNVLTDICKYFYDNHTFYRKVLSVSGQNSFSDHLREIMCPIMRQRFSDIFPREGNWDFHVNILSDIFIIVFQDWLSVKNPMPPEELMAQIKLIVKYVYKRIESMQSDIQ